MACGVSSALFHQEDETMRGRRLRWCLYMALGVLLGAGAALANFFNPELRAWAQGSSGQGKTAKGKILPIPEPATKPITEIDARKAKAPPRFQVKPPKGA